MANNENCCEEPIWYSTKQVKVEWWYSFWKPWITWWQLGSHLPFCSGNPDQKRNELRYRAQIFLQERHPGGNSAGCLAASPDTAPQKNQCPLAVLRTRMHISPNPISSGTWWRLLALLTLSAWENPLPASSNRVHIPQAVDQMLQGNADNKASLSFPSASWESSNRAEKKGWIHDRRGGGEKTKPFLLFSGDDLQLLHEREFQALWN